MCHMGYAPPCFTVTLLLTNFVRHTHLDSLPKCVEEKFSEKGPCLGSPLWGKRHRRYRTPDGSPSIRTPSGAFSCCPLAGRSKARQDCYPYPPKCVEDRYEPRSARNSTI